MIRQTQDRINQLKLTINLLEDHLRKYEHLIGSRQLNFIKGQIKFCKRELQIREDYPT